MLSTPGWLQAVVVVRETGRRLSAFEQRTAVLIQAQVVASPEREASCARGLAVRAEHLKPLSAGSAGRLRVRTEGMRRVHAIYRWQSNPRARPAEANPRSSRTLVPLRPRRCAARNHLSGGSKALPNRVHLAHQSRVASAARTKTPCSSKACGCPVRPELPNLLIVLVAAKM